MNLPIKFKNKMREMLQDKFALYEENFDSKPFRAFRVNTLKTTADELKKVLGIEGQPTEFCKDSYIIPDNLTKIGNNPLHHAGAFYIQEPSASSVVEALGVEKGDFVLDLCASPGGKSTQAGAKLCGEGVLVANEFVVSRVQPLVSNIERMGITNAVVTSLRPDLLCPMFTEFFDKVIVDAPCSGEGMFRKEAAAVENWSQENVLSCAERQKKILESAASTVKPGGKIAYSTCTYSYEENEFVIKDFLQKHPDFKLVKPCIDFGESAFSKYAEGVENIEYARRIFNFNGGEGHFVAVMQRMGDSFKSDCKIDLCETKSSEYKLFKEFFEYNFNDKVPENVCVVGDKVYITTKLPKINNLRMVRNGIFAGVCKNGRFVPEHALFNNVLYNPKNIVELQQGEMVNKFIHGEEIPCDISLKGYTQVRVCGVPLGFGKASGGTLKNHYPKGLRTL